MLFLHYSNQVLFGRVNRVFFGYFFYLSTIDDFVMLPLGCVFIVHASHLVIDYETI